MCSLMGCYLKIVLCLSPGQGNIIQFPPPPPQGENIFTEWILGGYLFCHCQGLGKNIAMNWSKNIANILGKKGK